MPNSEIPEAVKRVRYLMFIAVDHLLTLQQRVQMLEDFEEHFEEIGNLLLEREVLPYPGAACACGKPSRLANTVCNDCIAYSPTCEYCFLELHRCNPFHWAEVWDAQRGFFVRHDASKLDVTLDPQRPSHRGAALQLGHSGAPCRSPDAERLFTVMDANGVHSVRIVYCGCCEQPPNKLRQLLRAGLFPASTRDPLTAFTITVLKQFELHNLVSKKAAYDYVNAIRRLSDNAFAGDVPVGRLFTSGAVSDALSQDPYPAFLRTARIYNYLTLLKRSGQLHGIDKILPHRPAGNVLVWCPACPQPGFNTDPTGAPTPNDVR
jgi:hypothetical protein